MLGSSTTRPRNLPTALTIGLGWMVGTYSPLLVAVGLQMVFCFVQGTTAEAGSRPLGIRAGLQHRSFAILTLIPAVFVALASECWHLRVGRNWPVFWTLFAGAYLGRRRVALRVVDLFTAHLRRVTSLQPSRRLSFPPKAFVAVRGILRPLTCGDRPSCSSPAVIVGMPGPDPPPPPERFVTAIPWVGWACGYLSAPAALLAVDLLWGGRLDGGGLCCGLICVALPSLTTVPPAMILVDVALDRHDAQGWGWDERRTALAAAWVGGAAGFLLLAGALFGLGCSSAELAFSLRLRRRRCVSPSRRRAIISPRPPRGAGWVMKVLPADRGLWRRGTLDGSADRTWRAEAGGCFCLLCFLPLTITAGDVGHGRRGGICTGNAAGRGRCGGRRSPPRGYAGP